LRFFAPHGRHVAPMGVKFGSPPPCQISPPSVQRQGVGPPKLKFLLRFDGKVEYKRPAGAYPLRDFNKICRVCSAFQDALGVKILLDLLKGLWSYWGFNLRGSACPKFSAPPSGETMHQTSVCLFVRHAFERQSLCARFRHEGVGVQKRF